MAKWGLLVLPVVLEGASVAWAAMAGGFGPPLGAVACGVITVLAPRSGVGRAAFAAGVRSPRVRPASGWKPGGGASAGRSDLVLLAVSAARPVGMLVPALRAWRARKAGSGE